MCDVPPTRDMDALRNMHKAFLEALRHREQEILQYLAFVGPALAGFVWLMTLDYGKNAWVFVVGTLGIILLLFLGACYSLALGYNYRYLTLQMAKIESPLGLNIVEQILNRWPRRKADFDKYTYRCNPPNIIYTFWVACMVGILLITILGVSAVAGQELSRLGTWPSSEVTVSVGGAPDHTDVRTEVREVVPRGHLAVRASLALGRVAVVGFAGLTCLLVAWLLPRRYGTKMKDLLDKEPPEWKPGGEA